MDESLVIRCHMRVRRFLLIFSKDISAGLMFILHGSYIIDGNTHLYRSDLFQALPPMLLRIYSDQL